MLRECPFCEDDVNVYLEEEKDGKHCVCCPLCECIGPLAGTPEEAEELWNTRAGDDDIE